MKANNKVEFGDFQTPLGLAQEVCALLLHRSIAADFILEPTCGLGRFLVAAAESFPKAQLVGCEINADYVTKAVANLALCPTAVRAHVFQQDFFSHDWERQFSGMPGRLLILGNLPWVTNTVFRE